MQTIWLTYHLSILKQQPPHPITKRHVGYADKYMSVKTHACKFSAYVKTEQKQKSVTNAGETRALMVSNKGVQQRSKIQGQSSISHPITVEIFVFVSYSHLLTEYTCKNCVSFCIKYQSANLYVGICLK